MNSHQEKPAFPVSGIHVSCLFIWVSNEFPWAKTVLVLDWKHSDLHTGMCLTEMHVRIPFSPKLTVFPSHCNQLSEHKCTITLCWKDFNLQLEMSENAKSRTQRGNSLAHKAKCCNTWFFG